MKRLSFKKQLEIISITFVIVILTAFVSGCNPTEKSIVGDYERKGNRLTEKLVLRPGHSYEQELIYASGQRIMHTNTWSLSGIIVFFNEFYSSVDLVTADEIEAPKKISSSNFTVKGDLLVAHYEKGYFFKKK